MRISDWSSDVCSSDLPPGKATWKRSRATTRTSSLSDDSRPAASPRGVDLEPLSCEAGEGGAKRRVRARLCIRMQNPKTPAPRSEEHTSELQSLMRISYAVVCLKKKTRIVIAHYSK